MPIKLRDYQEDAIAKVLEARDEGIRRSLLVLGTGAGKTIIAAELIRRLNVPTLFLAHREELLTQTIDKLHMVWPGAPAGIVQASQNEYHRQIVVASVQTLVRRVEKWADPDRFGLIIADEAHHATSPTFRKVLKAYGFLPEVPDGKLLVGVTATPDRADGVGLGNVFQKIVYKRNMLDLIRTSYLSDLRGVRVVTKLDLDQVKVQGDDFDEKELSLAVNSPDRNRLIAKAVQEHAHNRKTIVFAVNVAHAIGLSRAFAEANFRAAVIHGAMPKELRKQILGDFDDGKTQVLCNCNILTEGYDSPAVDAIVVARPTKSRSLFAQMVGRGTRLYPGKENCLVIDVADNSSRHNLVGLPSLLGLSIKEVKEGVAKALREQDETLQITEEGTLPLPVKGIKSQELDILDRSMFIWTKQGARMVLEVGPGEVIILAPAEDDKYTITYRGKGQTEELSNPLPLGYAQGVAEDYIREHQKESFAARDAAWRTEPATEKQRVRMRELGLECPEHITGQEAHDLIGRESKRRTLENPNAPWRTRPASPAQMTLLEKHDLPRWSNMTSGDASSVADSLFKKRWAELAAHRRTALEKGGVPGRAFGKKKAPAKAAK